MTLSDLERLAREATPGKRTRTTSGDRHWLREVEDNFDQMVVRSLAPGRINRRHCANAAG